MTKKLEKEAIAIIHEMALMVRSSHGGWWEAYSSDLEKRFVVLSDKIKHEGK